MVRTACQVVLATIETEVGAATRHGQSSSKQGIKTLLGTEQIIRPGETSAKRLPPSEPRC
jgi:hypothetical protein